MNYDIDKLINQIKIDDTLISRIIKYGKYDPSFEYIRLVPYAKKENERKILFQLSQVNGLLSIYYNLYPKKEKYNGFLFKLIDSELIKNLKYALKDLDVDERDILKSFYGVGKIKKIISNENVAKKQLFSRYLKLSLRTLKLNYENESGITEIRHAIEGIKTDYENYFRINKEIRKNKEVIQTLLDNAKFRTDNYGELLNYVTDSVQRKQLEKIIKTNGYIALYMYISKYYSENGMKMNSPINNILNRKLNDIKEDDLLFKIVDRIINNSSEDISNIIINFTGIKDGIRKKLSEVIKKYPNINIEQFEKALDCDYQLAVDMTKVKKFNPIPLACVLIAATIGIGGTIMFNSSKKDETLEDNTSSIIDMDLKPDNKRELIVNNDIQSEDNVFIHINDSMDDKLLEEKINDYLTNNKKVGLIVIPNSNPDFINNIKLRISYLISNYKIKLPILYDVSVLKDDMQNNCTIANDFVKELDSMHCYTGFYGDPIDMKRLYDNDSYEMVNKFDKMLKIDKLTDIDELDKNILGNMFVLSDNSIVFYNNIPELINEYNLNVGKKEVIQNPNNDNLYNDNSILKTFDNGDAIIKGVDVSVFNGKLDWNYLKENGVGFAIIRVADCLTYSYDEPYTVDSQFQNNLNGCIENGIPFCFYYYTRAENPEDAVKEANFIKRVLYENDITNGLVFVDLETEESEMGLNITLDEKIKNSDYIGSKQECINIMTAMSNSFKEGGFDLLYYCHNDVHEKINDWMDGSKCWVTSHETYHIGIPSDLLHITQNDGFFYNYFSINDILDKYTLNQEMPIVQHSSWGKFENINVDENTPQFFDIDYSSKNYIDRYFHSYQLNNNLKKS